MRFLIFYLVIKNIFGEINFFDLLAGLLLFLFLYAVGNLLKYLFRFESVSLGITLYLFSFFIFDCIILFFYQKLTFLEVLLVVNLLWFSFFVFKLKSF